MCGIRKRCLKTRSLKPLPLSRSKWAVVAGLAAVNAHAVLVNGTVLVYGGGRVKSESLAAHTLLCSLTIVCGIHCVAPTGTVAAASETHRAPTRIPAAHQPSSTGNSTPRRQHAHGLQHTPLAATTRRTAGAGAGAAQTPFVRFGLNAPATSTPLPLPPPPGYARTHLRGNPALNPTTAPSPITAHPSTITTTTTTAAAANAATARTPDAHTPHTHRTPTTGIHTRGTANGNVKDVVARQRAASFARKRAIGKSTKNEDSSIAPNLPGFQTHRPASPSRDLNHTLSQV